MSHRTSHSDGSNTSPNHKAQAAKLKISIDRYCHTANASSCQSISCGKCREKRVIATYLCNEQDYACNKTEVALKLCLLKCCEIPLDIALEIRSL
jgi:hypothetical protein